MLLQAQDMAEHPLTVCTVPWLLPNIPEGKANLDFFLHPSPIMHYVSYHVADKHSSGTVHGYLFAVKKDIQWWGSTPGGQYDSFREGFAWL